jgi:NAD(P)-dependent dehydrogenase (short-subunit alcohol dehydrogenase family)
VTGANTGVGFAATKALVRLGARAVLVCRHQGRGADLAADLPAVHPGVLATRIWNRNLDPLSLFMLLSKPFLRRSGVGGEAVAQASVGPTDEVNGQYFSVTKRIDPAPICQDTQLAGRLWELSWEIAGLPMDQLK